MKEKERETETETDRERQKEGKKDREEEKERGGERRRLSVFSQQFLAPILICRKTDKYKFIFPKSIFFSLFKKIYNFYFTIYLITCGVRVPSLVLLNV